MEIALVKAYVIGAILTFVVFFALDIFFPRSDKFRGFGPSIGYSLVVALLWPAIILIFLFAWIYDMFCKPGR